MARRNYKTFTQRELDGGMNLDSSPNEIENKQCLSAINFNVDGNKLVSAKSMSDSGNPTTANIGALTIDSGDIWTVSNGDILKNGVVVDSGVGILVSTNSDTFKPGVAFYLTINGVNYTITGLSVQDFIYNLKAAVEANGLITVAQDNIILIRKADGSALTYSVDSNKACIIYNQDSTVLYQFGKDYVFAIEINGVLYEGIYTPSDTFLNAGQKDVELMAQLEAMLPSSLNSSNVYVDTSDYSVSEFYTEHAGIIVNNVSSIVEQRFLTYEYRINGYTSRVEGFFDSSATSLIVDGVTIYGPYVYRIYDDGNIANINVPGDWNISINIEGNVFSYSTASSYRQDMVTSLINSINAHGSYTAFQGAGSIPLYSIVIYKNNGLAMSSISVTDTTPDIYYDGSYRDIIHKFNNNIWVNNAGLLSLFKSRILTQLNAISGISAVETTKDGVVGIYFRKNAYKQVTYTDTNLTNDLDIVEIQKISVEIRQKTYEEVNAVVRPLSDGGGLLGRAYITVGNLGNLVVDRDSGGAFYSYEGMKVKISDTSVGEPKLGTIYQGKIVLGGYEGNDNIVFSQTSSITTSLNVLEFGAYNAGGQSVSGGNKSKVTGFSVGENGLYVFKENEVWYTNSETDSPNNSRFNYIFNKITNTGAYSQTVITQVEQDIFYLDWINRKVRRLSYEQNLTTLRDTAISGEIDSLFSTLPANQALATSSFKYPNYKLYLSDHTGGSITYHNGQTYYLNNKCFVYNVSNKSWFLENDKTGVIVAEDGYIAKNDGKIYLDDTGFKTSGSYLSKHFDMGESVGYKRFTEFDIYGENSNNTPLYLDIYKEGVLSETFLIEGTTFRKKFGLWNQGRFFQFGLRYEGVSNIVIHDFSIEFKELYGFDIYKG